MRIISDDGTRVASWFSLMTFEQLSTLRPKEPTMRKNIITLASSVAVGLLALTGLQGSAQAYEYRHHVTRIEHRDPDRDHFHFRFFSHRDRDHERR
jgi:uncharacterized membrane protein